MHEQKPLQPPKPLIIGYLHLRARVQVARLLCQYFSVPYVNKIYQHPSDWLRQRQCPSFQSWTFLDLPYLIDDDVTLTQVIPIVSYIAEKYGPVGFLGQTPEDQTRVDMFLWSSDLVMKKVLKIGCPTATLAEEAEREKIQLWNLHVKEKLKFMETYQRMGEWLLGYLTICDFFIYEMLPYLELFFPGSTGKCTNLRRIATNIGKLEKIKEYEQSDRAITCRLPKQAWDRHAKPKIQEKLQQKGSHP